MKYLILAAIVIVGIGVIVLLGTLGGCSSPQVTKADVDARFKTDETTITQLKTDLAAAQKIIASDNATIKALQAQIANPSTANLATKADIVNFQAQLDKINSLGAVPDLLKRMAAAEGEIGQLRMNATIGPNYYGSTLASLQQQITQTRVDTANNYMTVATWNQANINFQAQLAADESRINILEIKAGMHN